MTQVQPNIVFIMADDLGYADLSCYGRLEYETPALDRLAAQGLRLTNAYANSAVCTATRVALMTGRYQYRLPIGLEEPLQSNRTGLPPEHPTLPSLLRDNGYHTALVGKWHLGELPEYCPLKSGFDEFWGIRGGGVDYFTHELDGVPDLWDGTENIERTGYLTDLLGDRAVAVLEQRAEAGGPFFLNLNFTAPHWPWEGPEDEAESARLQAKVEAGEPMPILHYDGGDMATYAAMMRNLDANCGKVLEALDRLGLAENTVVVFTSDNGGERFSFNWPFTGKKTELLEGGLRIPALVRWPGVTQAGTTSDAMTITMDWLPTFVAAAGGAPDPDHPSDGVDIATALSGGALPERTLFWRFAYRAQKAARRGDHKFLEISGKRFLFDVTEDPLERGNLKDREPELFEGLQAAWHDWNADMLPPDPEAGRHYFTAAKLAEYFGVDS
ncbi:sulfatase-like hydrolase/transferase [Aurantiacibacter sp. MUD11]|uniref:sulfatase-like hydrolase/transferase n=1 Tax=Aurantiacibacter sp. MUD11 TaxID=3003265 RepID=UPI0022AADDD7|nr:sulfatase-like hydrolase/transferase [Aurantiacibacter sp. MUD11]WAT17897.1 sulfatase-like hydrolase/transferase [Aurantiacibacter sp. MUD11]